jgi:hypothetical protein
MATSIRPQDLSHIPYQPTTMNERNPATNRSTLDHLASELARIEGLAVAGHCDAHEALQAVLRAVASVDKVSAVDIVIVVGNDFVTVASTGIERLFGRREHFQVYADCVATRRFVLSDKILVDPRFSGIPFSSMMVAPLSAPGNVAGVLAVYSSEPGALGHDFIVPIGTAAVICSALAPEVLESKAPQDSATQLSLASAAAGDGAEPLVGGDERREHGREPEVRVQHSATVAEAARGIAATKNTSNFGIADLKLSDTGTRDRQFVQHVTREEAIQSIVSKNSAKQFRRIHQRSALVSLRRPLWIAALLLLLSGLVFGSMIMLRHSATRAVPRAAAAATATRSASVTKLVGAPRPMQGMAVAADVQITAGRLIQQGMPAYPQDALARMVQGDVTAILFINERGAVEDVRVTGGDTSLSAAVSSSLSHWRFAPFEANGRAIPVELPVMVAFHVRVETDSPSK